MRRSLRTTAAALALIGATSPARSLPNPEPQPAGPVIVFIEAYTYVPGDQYLPQGSLTIHEGTQIVLANLDDFGYHTMISYEDDSNGVPLFSSGDQIGPGQTTNVSGTASLPPATYHFFCTNHANMGGVLVVIP
ncbi:MAG: cupredoxin domain-containing protein [Actinomycetota bacterium]